MVEMRRDPAQVVAAPSTITGRVTSKTSFGAFVEVADDVEGLVHESETAVPLDDLSVGGEVGVRLERFHLDKRRLAFSLVDPNPNKAAPPAKRPQAKRPQAKRP